MFNKNKNEYSWWSYRSGARQRNIGWRIDYIFITTKDKDLVTNAFIQQNIKGSDHCPVGITLKID